MNTSGGSGGYDEMTKDELIEEIGHLNRELEMLQNEIQDLNQKNFKLQRQVKKYDPRAGDGSEDDPDNDNESMGNVLNAAALETENEELREKLSKLQADLLVFKEKNLELNSHLKVYQTERLELEADVRNLRKKNDELEKTLTESEESMRANMRKSQDINKQKKDTQKQQLQLYDENERLQKEVPSSSSFSLCLSPSLSLYLPPSRPCLS
jgi:chromosome segregation ATPase